MLHYILLIVVFLVTYNGADASEVCSVDGIIERREAGPFQANDTITFDFDFIVNLTEMTALVKIDFYEGNVLYSVGIWEFEYDVYELDENNTWSRRIDTVDAVTSEWAKSFGLQGQDKAFKVNGNLTAKIIDADRCSDTCPQYNNNEVCDDTWYYQDFKCDLGSDCSDCGIRHTLHPGQSTVMQVKVEVRVNANLSSIVGIEGPTALIPVIFLTFDWVLEDDSHAHVGQTRRFKLSMTFPMATYPYPWMLQSDAPIVNGAAVLSIQSFYVLHWGENIPCFVNLAVSDTAICSELFGSMVQYESTTTGLEIDRAKINLNVFNVIKGNRLEAENRIDFQVEARVEDHRSLADDPQSWLRMTMSTGGFTVFSYSAPVSVAVVDDQVPELNCTIAMLNDSEIMYTGGENIVLQLSMKHEDQSPSYAYNVIANILTTPFVKYTGHSWNEETITENVMYLPSVGNIPRLYVRTLKFAEELNVLIDFVIDPDSELENGTYTFVGALEVIYKNESSSPKAYFSHSYPFTFNYTITDSDTIMSTSPAPPAILLDADLLYNEILPCSEIGVENCYLVCQNVISARRDQRMCYKVVSDIYMIGLPSRLASACGWDSTSDTLYGIANDMTSHIISQDDVRCWYSVTEEDWHELS
ncbi:uncharacterized protein [Ptychodera flava]|uniref:uncharacterized protein n=1 Tax=Ptychodera flava TaxID=63121 RepID=UPI003969CAF0